MLYIYVTATHMFKQEATKESKSGKISAGGSAMGAVYQWNKAYSGNAGAVTFRSYATKEVGRLTFETKSRIPNAFVDTPIMNVAQKGTAQFNGQSWVVTVEQRQSIPGGQAAVPFTRTSYSCQVKEGRHLL